MRVNPKIVQLIGDAVIPILGYFLWNWSLYFIVIFYLIDYIGNEVFVHFKSKRIAEFSEVDRSVWISKSLISASLLTTVIVLTHAAILKIQPGIDLSSELIEFWTYKDMGIEQGYVLLPLIMLVGYQRYKLEFIVPEAFKKISMETHWKAHLFSHFVLLGVLGIVLGISVFVIMPETVYLIGIIVLTSVYQVFFKAG